MVFVYENLCFSWFGSGAWYRMGARCWLYPPPRAPLDPFGCLFRCRPSSQVPSCWAGIGHTCKYHWSWAGDCRRDRFRGRIIPRESRCPDGGEQDLETACSKNGVKQSLKASWHIMVISTTTVVHCRISMIEQLRTILLDLSMAQYSG